MKPEIEKKLSDYRDQYLQKNLLVSGIIDKFLIIENTLELILNLPFAGEYYVEYLKRDLTNYFKDFDLKVIIKYKHNIKEKLNNAQNSNNRLKNIKQVIAIASGKGGVGKSTTATNLALALHQQGAKVAILDADLYGPSQQILLGTKGAKPESDGKKYLSPIFSHGIYSMSIGYLLPESSTPIIWRGPIVGKALQQLLFDTVWPETDYLIIDLPPGTGDVQLTLTQKVPVTGSVVITTPQDIALTDAIKASQMFHKVKVPVLGVIENMSYYICAKCDNIDYVFEKNGGERMAKEYDINFLGKLPLDKSICTSSDQGKPIVIQQPDNKITNIYHDIALKIAISLSELE